MSPPSAGASTASSDRGVIEGRVTDAHGAGIEEAAVMITGDSPAHSDIAALTDTTGSFAFTSLIPGAYTVLVNAPDRAPRRQSVDVKPGAVARLDFVLD